MSENKSKKEFSPLLKVSKTVDKQKLQKLKALKEMGINTYPYAFTRTIFASKIKEKFGHIKTGEKLEKEVYSIAGRIMLRRKMGKAAFMDILDATGRIQVYIQKPELTKQEVNIFSNLDIGDIVGITGFIFRTNMGELSVHCQKLELLTKSLATMPEKFHGLADIELKYRQRYLDLNMNEEVRETFKLRSKIFKEVRNFLDKRGFMEVETPILQPIYGGALAHPFKTHHRDLDATLYMRISPELYLKKLTVGGLEKVYEIGKNFRNEGIDTTHNPEYTAIEWYEAYTDYNYQMEQVEQLVEHVVKVTTGDTVVEYDNHKIDFKAPWKRLSVYDGLREYAKINPEIITKADLIREIKKYTNKIDEDKSHGELLMELFDEAVEDKLIQPTFVIDHPVEVSPLTKMHRAHPKLVERFESYAAGIELSNAYSELNDPEDQAARFLEQEDKRGRDEEAHPMDKSFLHAIEVGLPPTGGVGIGLDRLVMIITGKKSIRDVIFFPTMKLID
ncbi:lysine--tRNA ligase [Pseudomonadota bacterium]